MTTLLVGARGAGSCSATDWLHSFLLGAVVSSTDAAAVFFLLRVGGIHLRDRVRSVLEVEFGLQRSDGDLPHRDAASS